MKRKTLSGLLIVLLLSLSACGSNSTTTAPVKKEAVEQEQVQAEKEVVEEVEAEPSEEVPEVKEEAVVAEEVATSEVLTGAVATVSTTELSVYSGTPYVVVNNNVPGFTSEELVTNSFETYSSLDNLGRCGVAYANIGKDIMPTEERGNIGSVKPSGWQTIKYDCVDGKYLYNRCHLIGFQLTGENANESNLITGTRYMNVDGMLPFENMVADYIQETNNHVLYRVTPIFEGNNPLASGVQMEAFSVEDDGDGICFNVYCYNVQPGIAIDYATGNSTSEAGTAVAQGSTTTQTSGSNTQTPATTVEITTAATAETPATAAAYILNTNTMKFHKPSCSSVKTIKEENKGEFNGSRDDLINQGYAPCKNCNP